MNANTKYLRVAAAGETEENERWEQQEEVWHTACGLRISG